MGSISIPAAALIAGSSVASAGIGALGSMSAAGAQESAANSANATQLAMYNQTQALENPYIQTGYGAMNTLNYLLGLPTQSTGAGAAAAGTAGTTAGSALTTDQANALLQARPDVMQAYQQAVATADPNSPAFAQKGLTSPQAYANYWYSNMGGSGQYQVPGTTQAGQSPVNTQTLNASGLTAGSFLTAPTVNLQQDPSYQFQLQQGLGAVQNAASVYGAGGNTLKALNDYAQNAASTDYWNIYNADVTQRNSLYSMLSQLSGSGQNAAAGLSAAGQNTATAIGQNTIGAGNASAAGTVGATNAVTGAANSGVSNYLMYNLMQNMPGAGYASI